jgi:hypothetical protein
MIGRRYIEPFFTQRFSGVTAAYSLRKLNPKQVNCIRVRRSSDNTEQDIGFVWNRLDTASLLSFVGAGNGFVTTWYDQSGNGYNITQGAAAAQPRIVNGGVLENQLGKPCLTYSGGQTLISAAIPDQTITSGCNIALFSVTNANTNQQVSQLTNLSVNILAAQQNLNRLYVYGGQNAYIANNNINPKLVEGLYNGNNSNNATRLRMFINNSEQTGLTYSGTVAASLTTSSHAFRIGGLTGAFHTGKTSEVFYFLTNIETHLPSIRTNINNYYGIY